MLSSMNTTGALKAMEEAAAKRCDVELKDPRQIESAVELSAAERAER